MSCLKQYHFALRPPDRLPISIQVQPPVGKFNQLSPQFTYGGFIRILIRQLNQPFTGHTAIGTKYALMLLQNIIAGANQMSVFSRFTDILNANINSLLEKAEDPEKIIRLMIQEMEDTLVEIRSSAAKCIADRKEQRRYAEYLEREQQGWSKRAELAVRQGREDLARAALAEKQGLADEVAQTQHDTKLLEEQLEKFNSDITQPQSKLTDAKTRQRSIVIRHKTANSQLAARKHIHDDTIDEMLFRFENAEKRIDRVEAQGESLNMGRRKGLAEEIAGLEDDDRVEDELAALKAKVNKPSAEKPAKPVKASQEEK
jgi:phage shock protein A